MQTYTYFRQIFLEC